MSKYRILKRKHRLYGTWFAVQKKIFLWWRDLPCIYKNFDDAVLDLMENNDFISDEVSETIEVDLKA